MKEYKVEGMGIIQLMGIYRLFNKEGHKVLGYKTNKKFDFEAIKQLKASKNMGHFDNQSSFFKRWT